MTESGRRGDSVYLRAWDDYEHHTLKLTASKVAGIGLEHGGEAGAWVTATTKRYYLAVTSDHYGARGRFHHPTYAVDSREDVLRGADIFLENGIYIETGPHKHAIQQTFFLYVYEPG